MKILLLISSMVVMTLPLQGQVTFQPKSIDFDNKGVVYSFEKTVDFIIHPNGWAVAYNTGQITSYNRTKYYHFEIGKISDPREKSQSRPYNLALVRGNGSFAYGKINNFYTMRAGMGRLQYLSEKAKRKGIAVGYNYEIGPALGFLKPYYVQVYESNEAGKYFTKKIKYSEETKEQFLELLEIHSQANFSEGLLETKIIPGLQGKIGVHFDVGAYDEYVKAVEIGAMLDVYTRVIPLMAPTENHSNTPFFFNLYVNLHFGKRN